MRAPPSGCLVGFDLPFDLVRVSVPVAPRLDQILGAQGRIGLEKVGLAGPSPSRLHQQPDGDSGANDARLTPAHAGLA